MKNFFTSKLLTIFCGLLFFALIAYFFSQGYNGYAIAVTILPTTALQKVNLMTEDAWADNQRAIENDVEADSLATFIGRQNKLGEAFVRKLTDPKKDNADVRVMWVDFCGDAAQDCDADNYCNGIDGAEPGIDFKDYNLTQCITDDFKLSETTFAGSFTDMEDYIVKTQTRKITNLLNLLNTKLLLFLHANAGFNRGDNGLVFNVTNQTEVPAAQYADADLITNMMIDAKQSKVIRPYGLSGTRALYKTYLDAQLDEEDVAGGRKRTRQLDITFDMFGFPNAGAAVQNSTFLVTPYAAAFVNKNYYPNNVPTYDPDVKMEKYFIRIPAFGITVDTLHQRICENAKKNRFAHVWKYTLHFDFLTNPYGCADVNGKRVNGILEYLKV